MNIRKMTADDLPAIVPLATQLGYECSYEQLVDRFSMRLHDETNALFVGEDSVLIVAFMQVHETWTLMTGRRAEINAIVVDEKMRGKGYGREMMDVAENWARNRSLPKLRLGSRTSRSATHEFYKKYGFSVEKTWFIFSKYLKQGI